jgi:hypothetical protein
MPEIIISIVADTPEPLVDNNVPELVHQEIPEESVQPACPEISEQEADVISSDISHPIVVHDVVSSDFCSSHHKGASGANSGASSTSGGSNLSDSCDGGAEGLGSHSSSEADVSRPSAASDEAGPAQATTATNATAVAGVTPVPSCRRFEKRKREQREDSLDSTHTASSHQSIRSSSGGLYNNQSDTGSVLSHRFSTISISSNVSSDISFGNASAVSGSSCYLASMSSADFDDRPALASSFSLSEAEENEYLSSQGGGGNNSEVAGGNCDISEGQGKDPEDYKDQQHLQSQDGGNSKPSTSGEGGKNGKASGTVTVKKDQLSPPRIDGKTPVLHLIVLS